jgi:geranylgeranyl pyrophosphate synthase
MMHPPNGPKAARAEQPLLTAGQNALAQQVQHEFDEPRLAKTLDARAEPVHDRHWQAALLGPLLELLERRGKCFRSQLVQIAYDLAQGSSAPAMPAQLPLLVEALHAGSLIVDDIEDDSKSRRGEPALHVLVGLPLALNAGNWLYFLPHRLLEELGFEADIELELRRAIDRSVLRCHYGQALDLGVRLGSLAQREVYGVVSLSTRLKTGSLLELAAEVGAIAGGAEPNLRATLATFARRYGVALQMLDDASGLYHPGRAQKGYEDLLNGCPTWPWAWLAEQLDQLSYSRLQHQARDVVRRELEPEALTASMRRHLGDYPREHIQHELSNALEELEKQVEDRDRLQPLADEIARLVGAYG